MELSSPNSNSMVTFCRVNDSDCEVYAKAGECSANPAWMLHNCKASCDWCDRTQVCEDLYPDAKQCQEWKRLGHCEKNPAWMSANCRSTCGICANPEPG